LLLATSGEKAVQLMQQNDVHLIISDMRMPAMSGAELLEKTAKSYPESYRILLTGYADVESTVNAVNRGKFTDTYKNRETKMSCSVLLKKGWKKGWKKSN
jgi:DNA-binding NtrC family response regulator